LSLIVTLTVPTNGCTARSQTSPPGPMSTGQTRALTSWPLIRTCSDVPPCLVGVGDDHGFRHGFGFRASTEGREIL
jgi:hypothetical protein